LSTKYIGKDEDLLFQCLNENCKEKFYLSWTKIQRGTECRFCSGKLAGKNNSLINADKKILDDWDYNKNKKSPSEYSMKTSQEVWWKCAKCGHEWKSRIDVRTMRGRGCQRCNLSKGEKQIIFILDSKKIQYVIQKRFSDCKFYYTLPFDFYIPSLNLCIEYNGIQHYESVKHFGGLEHFGDVQNKDIIKGEYCKENNIKLVKIPYWDFDNIEKILSEFICCLGGC
jgi:DNA-directed RNA polymerase subunit RPC12/RpoP